MIIIISPKAKVDIKLNLILIELPSGIDVKSNHTLIYNQNDNTNSNHNDNHNDIDNDLQNHDNVFNNIIIIYNIKFNLLIVINKFMLNKYVNHSLFNYNHNHSNSD